MVALTQSWLIVALLIPRDGVVHEEFAKGP